MKHIKYCLVVIIGAWAYSCSDQVDKPADPPITTMPFTQIDLTDLQSFKPASGNWQVVSNVFVDLSKDQTFIATPGSGILLNTPTKSDRDHLYSAFEHGDIELEFDVMMPVNSNSGAYFQGRYEVQLLDSWGVKYPQYSDLGGIYQRGEKGNEKKEYEGHPPAVNAAKAPGLWQHFKIIFQAPKFDAEGKKIANAIFREVWLNGILVHENQDVTGPTRASAYGDEQPLGPLMIQGDHGAVAFRNIKYKLYEDQKVTLSNIRMSTYNNASNTVPDPEDLRLESEITSDSISASMVEGLYPQKVLIYTGNMTLPKTGKYLFELIFDGGGGLFIVKGDTLIDMDGNYGIREPKYALTQLDKGSIPFTLVYNKNITYKRGFSLSVEGDGIAKYDLHAPGSIDFSQGSGPPITIQNDGKTRIQRSFLVHRGKIKTHAISVATPMEVNYSFDLAFGSLLEAWDGGFLDATLMWERRGSQLGRVIGLPIIIHGEPDFASLEDQKADWPDSVDGFNEFKQLGYVLDKEGRPEFSTEINGITITNKFIPVDTIRSLKRLITINGDKEIWHKIGEGEVIEKAPDGTYLIDDKNYFVSIPENNTYQVFIRQKKYTDELLLKIGPGDHEISYVITW